VSFRIVQRTKSHFSLCGRFIDTRRSSESSRGHGHSHPTVTHSAVGPMYAMGTPVPPHHHQGNDGVTEKKKKKEEKDREKHEKEKEKVSELAAEQTDTNTPKLYALTF